MSKKSTGYDVNLNSLRRKVYGNEYEQRQAKKREDARRRAYDMTSLVPPHMYDKNSRKVLAHLVGDKGVDEMLALISGVKNGLVINNCPLGMKEYFDFATGKKQCTMEDDPQGRLGSLNEIKKVIETGSVVRAGILGDNCGTGKEPMRLANGLRICVDTESNIIVPPIIKSDDDMMKVINSAERVKRIYQEMELDKARARKLNKFMNKAPTLSKMKSVIDTYSGDPEYNYFRKIMGAMHSDIDITNAQNMLYEITTQMPGYYASTKPSQSDYLKFYGIRVVGGKTMSGGKKRKPAKPAGGAKRKPTKKTTKKISKPGKKTVKKVKPAAKKKDKITDVNISDQTFFVTADIKDVTDLLID